MGNTTGAGRGVQVLPQAKGILDLIFIFGLLAVLHLVSADAEKPFLTWQPSPLWLPVLLASLQFGVADGLLAAAIAAAAYVGLGFHGETGSEEYFSSWITVWTTPGLWILTALIVGGTRSFQAVREDAVRRELTSTEEKAEVLARHGEKLAARIDLLERKIASGSSAMASSLCEDVTELLRSDREQFDVTLARCMEVLFGTCDYTLSVSGPSWSLEVERGTSSPIEKEAHQELQCAVASAGQVLSFMDPRNSTLLTRAGAVFAAPIYVPGSNRLVGVLAIRRIKETASVFECEKRVQFVALLVAHIVVTHYPELSSPRKQRENASARPVLKRSSVKSSRGGPETAMANFSQIRVANGVVQERD
jgi:hypothetical protein